MAPKGVKPWPTDAEKAERKAAGEILKTKGNYLFRQENYAEAAEMYNEAVKMRGTQPVYMSNLAATYLKLKDYDMAEKAASMALVHDPRMTKTRFRRGLARKQDYQLRGAKIGTVPPFFIQRNREIKREETFAFTFSSERQLANMVIVASILIHWRTQNYGAKMLRLTLRGMSFVKTNMLSNNVAFSRGIWEKALSDWTSYSP
ncbi:hypothetical protein DFH07DRAFT_796029 [Mycena maculata]|uniref:Uncharacterized protein n=1 Tax=Mycena maculata TaxID=230809 RepID=A0AAD7K7Q9_9AGAR|nr:hypothetical protein DFH07DRAFT_796029 [Mycena maculata]